MEAEVGIVLLVAALVSRRRTAGSDQATLEARLRLHTKLTLQLH